MIQAVRTLPVRPHLDQLKRQAKELLDAFLAGDAAAVAEVNAHYRVGDARSFALHDAQLVLARAYGFESWPKLKAYVDGVTVTRLAEAVRAGDVAQVRAMLRSRPELVNMEMAGNDEHMAIHFAVYNRDTAMVRVLMEAGADARKGIYPHRDATSALILARDRGYDDVVAAIEEEEAYRRQEMSCPNATISPVQDQVNAAIRVGRNEEVFRLLTADPSLIRACDREGGTPLHVAAGATNEAVVAWLLERRAAVRKKDLNGLTPLDHAALAADPRNGHAARFPAVARRLLHRGAELTIRAAVALGDVDRVRQLVQQETAVPADWLHGGLLTLAVKHGQLEMLRLLLDLGLDVDERMLLKELEEPTVSWGSPLWYAALARRYDMAELLLDRGADPNGNVYASGWPLDHAYRHGDEALKRLLLDRGAVPQPWTVTSAHDVAAAERMLAADPSEELARELVWSAGDVGCPEILALALPRLRWERDDRRWHALLIQPIRGMEPGISDPERLFVCMALLLERGMDVNVASRFGQTSLHFTAARQDHWGRALLTEPQRCRFARMLLDAGARLDLRDELLRSTPLGWACRWGRVELVKLLLDRGADPVEAGAEPWATPLAWARKMGHAAIVSLLGGG